MSFQGHDGRYATPTPSLIPPRRGSWPVVFQKKHPQVCLSPFLRPWGSPWHFLGGHLKQGLRCFSFRRPRLLFLLNLFPIFFLVSAQ